MYAILHDWGSEGRTYYEREAKTIYEVPTLDEAFKTALELNYSAPFEVVKRIKYRVEVIEDEAR
jgi:hypothetical protein